MNTRLPILGLSHLVYTCSDFKKLKTFLQTHLYDQQSQDIVDENPREKIAFVKNGLLPKFRMNACKSSVAGNPMLELLEEVDGKASKGKSRFQVVFGDRKEKIDLDSLVETEAEGFLKEKNAHNNLCLKSILIETEDLESSKALWTSFGYNPEIHDDFFSIRMGSLLQKEKLHMIFRKTSEKIPPANLDIPGFSCISMLCSNIQRCHISLKDQGTISPIFSLTIEGKKMNLFFFRAKTGEIYEFLTPQ